MSAFEPTMSALGQKRTCAAQEPVSAKGQKRTFALQNVMSAITPQADILGTDAPI